MPTDLAVRKAVARDKPYKLSDGGGLYLLVIKAGQRCWRVDYCFEELRSTAALKFYPTVALSEARAKRLEIKKQIAESIISGNRVTHAALRLASKACFPVS